MGDYTIYLVKKGANKPWNQDAYEPIRISWFMSAKGLESVLKVVMAHSANDQPLKTPWGDDRYSKFGNMSRILTFIPWSEMAE